MTVTWDWLLLACLLAFATKLSGYLLPARWLKGARMQRIASAMTIGLLASLVTLNTLGSAMTFDARLGSLAVAMVALCLRASFLLVVILGAGTAALLRFFGWG
ncbi:branched-chain amino acid transporter AzlD [Ventosimonas gracilis]|uniref:Branched-chain amino acid transporter AzlD n=1 Tax=Ventosimonas gracilis TaxID=1680762 RepID=A0A139SW63_9GAMM|nr:AzlD domain-containing protein [Ventosimonas gracilis]KXU38833.1 branched-chain amino acid transporter AzlD [Ventosimonas gracilis]